MALGFLKVKKKQFYLLKEKDRGAAAIFKTAEQRVYVFAMASNAIIVAPLIASYSVFSVMAGIAMLALSEVI